MTQREVLQGDLFVPTEHQKNGTKSQQEPLDHRLITDFTAWLEDNIGELPVSEARIRELLGTRAQ